MVRAILIAVLVAACGYGGNIADCAITCSSESDCPAGFECLTPQGRCRTLGSSISCASVPGDAASDALGEASTDAPPQFSSCAGLAATCGPSANDNCCSTATTIPGGTFFRGYDVATDGAYASTSAPATISPFELDKYEVTVGRFRAFIDAQQGTQLHPPSAGDGGHPDLASSGWDSSWNASLVAGAATLTSVLKCDPTWQTWTDTPGANESLPINCVTWYEAMAFCIWDGGYLPTRAEWNFAAAAGSDQRAYPWSVPPASTTIDCSYANEVYPAGVYCVGALNRVGSESPKGDGLWGHSDLAGNVLEWTLDWSAPLSTPCTDCAALTGGSTRVLLSGAFNHDGSYQRTNFSNQSAPTDRSYVQGIRCARPMP